jgi:hypothetical protein
MTAAMSFGRNPYIAKALAAEQKAEADEDTHAASRHYLEAAHLWDRAASREKPGKQRSEYEQNATRDRELAQRDESGPADEDGATRRLLH